MTITQAATARRTAQVRLSVDVGRAAVSAAVWELVNSRGTCRHRKVACS